MALARFALLLASLALAGSGCELVADFDRAKIPEADAGSISTPDGSLVPDGGPGDEDAGGGPGGSGGSGGVGGVGAGGMDAGGDDDAG